MSQHFEIELGTIRSLLLRMAEAASANLELAIQALMESDSAKARTVVDADSVVDQLELEIDERVVVYLSTHGAIARDCRFLLTASRISHNLERVADLSVTIARSVPDIAAQDEPPYPDEIPLMIAGARSMLADAMRSLVEREPELAREVVRRDKLVDQLYRRANQRLLDRMVESRGAVPRGMLLAVVTRNLERIADHAKAIAEEVVFLLSAEDIRHAPKN